MKKYHFNAGMSTPRRGGNYPKLDIHNAAFSEDLTKNQWLI
jgi:hypothetical protein